LDSSANESKTEGVKIIEKIIAKIIGKLVFNEVSLFQSYLVFRKIKVK